jgi:hypothetical protein
MVDAGLAAFMDIEGFGYAQPTHAKPENKKTEGGSRDMKCDKCGADWNVDAPRAASTTKCPFCNEDVAVGGDGKDEAGAETRERETADRSTEPPRRRGAGKAIAAIVAVAVVALSVALFVMQSDRPSTPSPSTQVGDLVRFGGYNWRVLDVQGGKALIISDRVVLSRQYHIAYEDVTWVDCTLRTWLNDDFYNSFSATDKARIAETHISNKDNEWYGTDGGGPDTTDRVFLLSLEEVVRYFGDSGQLANRPSDNRGYIDDQYNDARIAKTSDGFVSWWWLRSLGAPGYYAAIVDNDGNVNVYGQYLVNYSGVRPALWLVL